MREGYLLGDEVGQEDGAATHIRPFARKIDGAEEENPLLLDVPPLERKGLGD